MTARRLFANTGALIAARITAIILAAVTLAMVTRYLGSHRYGELVLAVAYAGIVNTISDVGLTVIGTRELSRDQESHDRRDLASLIFGLGLSVSLICGVVAWAVLHLIFPDPGDSFTRGATTALLAAGLFTPVTQIGTAMAAARGRTYLVAFAQSGAVITTALIVGLTVTIGLSIWWIVAGYALAGIASAVAFLAAGDHIRLVPRYASQAWRDLLTQSMPVFLTTNLALVYGKADIVLLGLLGTTTQVGIYGLSYTAVDALMILPGLLTLTIQPTLMQTVHHPERFAKVVQHASLTLQVVALGLVVFFLRFGTSVARILGGAHYPGSGTVLSILVVAVAVSFPSGVLGAGLVAMNKQSRMLRSTGVAAVSNIALNLILIPLYGVRGAAVAFVVSEILSLATVAYAYRSELPLPRAQHAGGNLVALGMMACAAYLGPTLLTMSPAPELLVWGTISGGFYCAGLWMTGTARAILAAPELV